MKTSDEFLEELKSNLKSKLKEFKEESKVFNWGKIYLTPETLTEYIINKIEKFEAEKKAHRK